MKIFYLLIVGTAVLFWSCTNRSPSTAEQPVTSNARPTAQQAEKVNSAPATGVDVNSTLRRIFADALIPVSQEHTFATGDFNGDGSPDLAALVRPAQAKLKTLNDPLANWTIQDATQAFFPPAAQRVVVMPPKPSPQSVHSNEVLLVVIHGYGPNGWRDPGAQQAYLVRHVGAGPIESRPAPDHVEGAPASIQHADVIYESSKQPAFVFWTGSQYAWRTEVDHTTKIAEAKSAN